MLCTISDAKMGWIERRNPVILRADSGTKLLCISYPMYERLVALAERGEELPPPLGRFLPKKSD